MPMSATDVLERFIETWDAEHEQARAKREREQEIQDALDAQELTYESRIVDMQDDYDAQSQRSYDDYVREIDAANKENAELRKEIDRLDAQIDELLLDAQRERVP